MRLWQSRRWRWMFTITGLTVMGLAGLCFYEMTTRDPVSVWSFNRLRQYMTHAEVEQILGGPAKTVTDLRSTPDILESDADVTYAAAKPSKIGDITGKVLGLSPSQAEIRPVTELHTWESSEGRLCVIYDREDRLAAAGFTQRITWRHKLAEWLPWMR